MNVLCLLASSHFLHTHLQIPPSIPSTPTSGTFKKRVIEGGVEVSLFPRGDKNYRQTSKYAGELKGSEGLQLP